MALIAWAHMASHGIALAGPHSIALIA